MVGGAIPDCYACGVCSETCGAHAARGVSDSEVRVNAEPADAVGGRSRMLARERVSGHHEELVLWLEDGQEEHTKNMGGQVCQKIFARLLCYFSVLCLDSMASISDLPASCTLASIREGWPLWPFRTRTLVPVPVGEGRLAGDVPL